MSTPFELHLPQSILDAMTAHAQAELPNECVGLLAGTIVRNDPATAMPMGQVIKRYPLINELASPTEFLSEPRSMMEADRDMRAHHLELLAIYHSHPTTHPIPSAKDRERSYSSNVVNMIISLKDKKPEVKAWWISETGYHEAKFDVVS